MVISRGGYTFRARSVLSVLAGSKESVTLTVTVKSPEVDFSSSRLFAAGIVAGLEVGDFVPGHIHVGNQIAFGNLLVIQIIEDLA